MRDAVMRKHNWANFLKLYSEQNAGRITRLGVFDKGNDYWIEDGLPLIGIDFDSHHNSVEIMLGDALTHTIQNVRKVQINLSSDEFNDGLEITNIESKTTILRFED